MPRAEKADLSSSSSSPTNQGAVCKTCQRKIGRKSDLARHMRIHAADKSELMHRCPFCKFANMQKSNVETHIRTHTGEKSRCCPDCSFATTDPGSLTRHRKRVHQYIPKSRIVRERVADTTQRRVVPPLSSSSPAPSDLGQGSPGRDDSSPTPDSEESREEPPPCIPRLIRAADRRPT